VRPAGFHLLEHPADVGIRATGADLEAALAQVVSGLAAVITDGVGVREVESRRLHLEADDLDGLVVDLVDECLYLLDAHGWLAGSATIQLEGSALSGTLRGEPFDDSRHADGVHVKAATWHQLAVVREDDGFSITVFLDI